jgi:hypothetical protein
MIQPTKEDKNNTDRSRMSFQKTTDQNQPCIDLHVLVVTHGGYPKLSAGEKEVIGSPWSQVDEDSPNPFGCRLKSSQLGS